MTLVRTIACLPSATGDPKDTVQMGLTFQKGAAGNATAAEASTVNGFMAHFLLDTAPNGDLANTNSLGQILAADVVRNHSLILLKAYDPILGGSPIAVDNPPGDMAAIFGGGTVRDMPRQVAIVVSMHGDLTGVPEEVPIPGAVKPAPRSTRPRARKRGRIYVGPLNTNCISGSPAHVDPNIAHFLGELLKGVRATASAAGWTLVVHSKKEVLAPNSPVTAITVDNRFDTQRRRAVLSTARYTAL